MKTVRVEALAGARYGVALSTGSHELQSDEAPEDGGDGLGPTPYELLLSALGSCMAITMRMYAERKQWPLEGVSIELTHEKVLDKSDSSEKRRIDVIHSIVSVHGPLSREQAERLHEIANRCPVHRTLGTPPRIISTLSATPAN